MYEKVKQCRVKIFQDKDINVQNLFNAFYKQGDQIWRKGRLFALGSYMQITEVSHIFGLLYSTIKLLY
jgi:hypothetical protein